MYKHSWYYQIAYASTLRRIGFLLKASAIFKLPHTLVHDAPTYIYYYGLYNTGSIYLHLTDALRFYIPREHDVNIKYSAANHYSCNRAVAHMCNEIVMITYQVMLSYESCIY